MEHFTSKLATRANMTGMELARRSGLSRSTIFRVQSMAVDPSVGTLRELALAAGFDIDMRLIELSDSDAARAARSILDPWYDSLPATAVIDWVARLHRWVASGDPIEIVRTAGEASSLLKRPGITGLIGSTDELKLAAAGDFSGAEWLLSGAPVLDRIRASGGSTESGPAVLYTADSERILRLLQNMRVVRAAEAGVIVAEYSSDLEFGAWADGPVRMVAPIQALIDGFGLGPAAAEVADSTARGW